MRTDLKATSNDTKRRFQILVPYLTDRVKDDALVCKGFIAVKDGAEDLTMACG